MNISTISRFRSLRRKKAILNTLAGFSYQVTSIISGFILPYLILRAFGSQYNGLISSVTQFFGIISLFRLSISGVTRAALYKPLSERKIDDVSAIILATQNFIRKIAKIFLVAMVIFAIFYPFIVKNNFDYLFTFSLILILGFGTFIQYYFGIPYQILLQADQRQGFLFILQILAVIVNTLLAVFLIYIGASIHIIKFFGAVSFSLIPFILFFYTNKKYNLNKHITPNDNALRQKWDSFGHATAVFIHSNTDIILLTLFTNVYEVSVYMVYSLVTNGLKTLFKSLTISVGPTFGDMLAKNEINSIKKNFDLFEYLSISFGTMLFTTAGIMMLPFISIYTFGVEDVEYIRPVFSFILVLSSAFFCFRIPYQMITEVAGHFKETRNGAFFEAFANIIISLFFFIKIGLVGVAIGTLFATVFRTLQYVFYLRNNILKRSIFLFFKQFIIASIISYVSVFIFFELNIYLPNNFFDFSFYLLFFIIIQGLVFFIFSLIFNRQLLLETTKFFTRSIKSK
jgi:O-antigen/teichoic acid export membrane protein